MAAYFGFDWWSPVFDVFNIEAEALGQALVWREEMEPWVDRDNPLLRERSDLDRLAPPIPGESGRMPFVIEVYRRFAAITGVAPVCICCSPFTLAAHFRGIKPLIVDMYHDPGYVDRLLTFLSQEVVVPWIRCLAETTGASTVVMCDPMASPPALSPSLLRRFRQSHVACRHPGGQLAVLHRARRALRPVRGAGRRRQPGDGRQATGHPAGAAARRSSRADRGRGVPDAGSRVARRPVRPADAPHPRRHAH